jgi:hypothetical protein
VSGLRLVRNKFEGLVKVTSENVRCIQIVHFQATGTAGNFVREEVRTHRSLHLTFIPVQTVLVNGVESEENLWPRK